MSLRKLEGPFVAQWYYVVADRQQGPFEEAVFRQMVQQGHVAPASLVWNESMDDWKPASLVPGLVAPVPVAAVSVAPVAGSPISLTYATPPVAGWAPVPVGIATIPGLANDAGPFLKIAGTFQGPRGNWTGPVYASPQAFYLLKVSRQQNYHWGGLIGIMIAAAAGKSDDIRTCKVCEVSAAAAAQLDRKGNKQDYDVIVLPMAAIRSVTYGKISSILHVLIDRINSVWSPTSSAREAFERFSPKTDGS